MDSRIGINDFFIALVLVRSAIQESQQVFTSVCLLFIDSLFTPTSVCLRRIHNYQSHPSKPCITYVYVL